MKKKGKNDMERVGAFITGYIKGKTPNVLGETEQKNSLPYLSPDYLRGKTKPELYTEYSTKTVLVEEGEIIVLWDGSNAGEVFVSKQGVLASTMMKLEFDEEEIDKNYFGYTFQYLEYILKAKTAGSGIPHADKGIIERLEFYKPLKSEQIAIASVLSKVDKTIESVQNSITVAERLKKSLMQNLLTGKMKPDGTFRKEEEFYMDEKFGKVPVGWEVKNIDSVSDFIQYGLNIPSIARGEIPMLRMNNITEGVVNSAPLVYVSLNEENLKRYKVAQGDILFNRTNSMDLVGKVGVFKLLGDFVFASYLIRIRISKYNNPYYINLALNSYPLQCALRSRATPAVSQANINAKSLRRTYILKPVEKEEQDFIVSQIDKIDDAILKKRVKIIKLKCLKKSLMQHLLTGKVRINLEIINKITS